MIKKPIFALRPWKACEIFRYFPFLCFKNLAENAAEY